MLGLTGGIASGKSAVSERLRELGAFVIDADEVSREVIDAPSVRAALLERFGGGIFLPDGGIDRRALAAAAFAAEDGTAALNGIMHPAIAESILRKKAEAEAESRYALIVIDAALLIESGFDRFCSGVWLVTADEEERVRRIMLRDGLTEAEARLRIARQMSDKQKALYASRIIKNDGSLEELKAKVDIAFAEEICFTGEGLKCRIL